MPKRMLILKNCENCPNMKTSHTPGTGFGQNWWCHHPTLVDPKKIAGYIEWKSEHPKNIPGWCPLPPLPPMPKE